MGVVRRGLDKGREHHLGLVRLAQVGEGVGENERQGRPLAPSVFGQRVKALAEPGGRPFAPAAANADEVRKLGNVRVSGTVKTVTAHGKTGQVQTFQTGIATVQSEKARTVTGAMGANYGAYSGPSGKLGW